MAMLKVTTEDKMRGTVVHPWHVAAVVASWYPANSDSEQACVTALQDLINRGEPYEAEARYLGLIIEPYEG
jgi:hypothetical protein